MREIDKQLVQGGLTDLQVDVLITERLRLLDILSPPTKQGKAPRKRGGKGGKAERKAPVASATPEPADTTPPVQAPDDTAPALANAIATPISEPAPPVQAPDETAPLPDPGDAKEDARRAIIEIDKQMRQPGITAMQMAHLSIERGKMLDILNPRIKQEKAPRQRGGKGRTAAPKETPVVPRRLFYAPSDPIVKGYVPEDLDALQTIAAHYHGEKGDFSYAAFRWANHTLFADQIPTTLIQWALTAFGRCLGYTQPEAERYPVITLHPGIWGPGPDRWQPGPCMTLDTVIHECLHAYILYVIGQEKGHSSHDNPTWANECMRLGPLLELPAFKAAPTKRMWKEDTETGKETYTRTTPEGCIDMDALAYFPQSLRPKGYFQGTQLPWGVPYAYAGA